MGRYCIAQGAQLSALGWPRGVSVSEVQEEGNICIYIADSCCCTAELTQHCNTIILQQKNNSVMQVSICYDDN